MEKKDKRKIKSFQLTGRDPRGRRMKLSFEQRAEFRKLHKEEEKKVDVSKIRRITVDSVYDSYHYRLLVAEFKAGTPIEEILHTKSWEEEYSILRDGKEYIREKDDPLLKEIPLSKSLIDEGRVFLLIDGYKYEITKYAKEDAKEIYKRVLAKRRKR